MWFKPLIENTKELGSNQFFEEDNCEYTIRSDGGVKDLEAGIGVITTVNGTTILENKVRIPSTFNDINSYRAEAFGMVTAVATYNIIQQYRKQQGYPFKNNSLRILCDSDSVVDKVNSVTNVRNMTNKFFISANADLITAISHLVQQTRLENGKIDIIHIRGHQDRGKPFEELSYDAQLNA
jgi:hypothetical protein